jgi:hypothetical protein
MLSNFCISYLRTEPISVDAEDALDAETASDFESEMNDGPTNVHDDEMMEGKSSWDLDADNQVHQGTRTMATRQVSASPFYRTQCPSLRPSQGR